MSIWDWNTFSLFLFSVMIGIYSIRKYELSNMTIYLIIGLLPTFLLLSCRDVMVGKDLEQYAISVTYSETYVLEGFEPFSRLIYWMSNQYGRFEFFIVTTSLLECTFFYFALKELHKNAIPITWFYAILFSFLVIRSFSMVRNGISISCSLVAYASLFSTNTRYRTRNYLVFSLIALGFHNSALINFFIYFICYPFNTNNYSCCKKKFIYRVILVTISFFLLITFFLNYFQNFVLSINDGRYEYFEIGTSLGIGNILIRIPLFVLVLFHMKVLFYKYSHNIITIMLFLYTDMLFSNLRYFFPNFERLTMYTGISEALVISMLFLPLKNKYGNIITVGYLILSIIYLCFYLYQWGIKAEYGIFPYKTWF